MHRHNVSVYAADIAPVQQRRNLGGGAGYSSDAPVTIPKGRIDVGKPAAVAGGGLANSTCRVFDLFIYFFHFSSNFILSLAQARGLGLPNMSKK